MSPVFLLTAASVLRALEGQSRHRIQWFLRIAHLHKLVDLSRYKGRDIQHTNMDRLDYRIIRYTRDSQRTKDPSGRVDQRGKR